MTCNTSGDYPQKLPNDYPWCNIRLYNIGTKSANNFKECVKYLNCLENSILQWIFYGWGTSLLSQLLPHTIFKLQSIYYNYRLIDTCSNNPKIETWAIILMCVINISPPPGNILDNKHFIIPMLLQVTDTAFAACNLWQLRIIHCLCCIKRPSCSTEHCL